MTQLQPDRQDDGLLREIGVLINEFDASNSDWAFRKRCLNELLDKLRATPPSRDAAEGAPGKCGCGPMCMDLGEEGNCRYLRPERYVLRALVDAVWNHATESQIVPSTDVADKLIDAIFEESVQPPPAPDAMRIPNALCVTMVSLARELVEANRKSADFDDWRPIISRIYAALSAPVPPADALRQNADHAHDELYGFASVPPADPRDDCASHRLFSEEKMLGSLRGWIRDTVPPADGALTNIAKNLDERAGAYRQQRGKLFSGFTVAMDIESMAAKIRAASPPAVAAEPDEWQRKGVLGKWITLQDATPERLAEWRRQGHELRPLYTSPPVRRDREAIARKLDEIAKEKSGVYLSSVCTFAMADAVLSLRVQPGAGERDACPKCGEPMGEKCCGDPDRQAPHSGDGEGR